MSIHPVNNQDYTKNDNDNEYILRDTFVFDFESNLMETIVDDFSSFINYEGNDAGAMEKSQEIYDADRELYKMLQMESFNIHGLPFLYHIVTYDTEYDPIFGEDNDKRCERVFAFMGYMPDVPADKHTWSMFAMNSTDEMVLHINKEHFISASSSDVPEEFTQDLDNSNGMYPNAFTENFVPSDSQTGSDSWESRFDPDRFDDVFTIDHPLSSYIPKVGDVIKMMYKNVFYQVKAVKEEEEMFLQEKHSWEIYLSKVMVNEHIEVADDINFDSGLGAIVGKDELFDDTDFVDEMKESLDEIPLTYPEDSGKGKPNPLYEPKMDEESPNDPFGGF